MGGGPSRRTGYSIWITATVSNGDDPNEVHEDVKAQLDKLSKATEPLAIQAAETERRFAEQHLEMEEDEAEAGGED